MEMKNVQNQKGDKFSSKSLVVLYNCKITEKYKKFSIKGVIRNQYIYSNKLILNIYEKETNEEEKIDCNTVNNNSDNYEIECYPKDSVIFNINNTLVESENNILLIIIDENSNDLINITQEGIFYKDYDSPLNSSSSKFTKRLLIAIIIFCIAFILLISIFLVIIIKKGNENEEQKNENNINNINNNNESMGTIEIGTNSDVNN